MGGKSVTNNMKNNTTEIRYPYVWIRDYQQQQQQFISTTVDN